MKPHNCLSAFLAIILYSCLGNIALGVETLQNTDMRKFISLNGEWHSIIDPYENGFYSYRYEERNDGYFKNAKPGDPPCVSAKTLRESACPGQFPLNYGCPGIPGFQRRCTSHKRSLRGHRGCDRHKFLLRLVRRHAGKLLPASMGLAL